MASSRETVISGACRHAKFGAPSCLTSLDADQ
jgi:hypothetical protein